MKDENKFHVFRIIRRRWYEWLFIGVWLFAEVMFMQAALASRNELEPRAAIVYWLVFAVLLLGGLVYWIVRRNRKM